MVLQFTTIHNGITTMLETSIWQPFVLILYVFQRELEYRAKGSWIFCIL